MRVDQALYGERAGGHSLLRASDDGRVSRAVVQRVDLPDTAPPGVDWSPFLRGFPYEDKYVLARTFQDGSASRGGMVFSHALLVSLEEAAETPNLGPLVSLLSMTGVERGEAGVVYVERSDDAVRQATDLVEAAEGLAGSGPLPVVRLGQDGFDDLVIALWSALWPEMRREFAFRLSFDPRDLLETPTPALVCTPRGMAGRWSEYSVMGRVAGGVPSSSAAAVLSGHGAAGPFVKFMRDVGVRPKSFMDLRLTERAYELVGDEAMTLERTVAAMRLLGSLAPDADVGEDGKEVLVGRLCKALSAAEAGDVLRLRNLDVCAFPEGERVWDAVQGWMTGNVYREDEDAAMLCVLRDAKTAGGAVVEWQAAIVRGFEASAKAPTMEFGKAFWRWLEIEPEVVSVAFCHVPMEAVVEGALARGRPSRVSEGCAAKVAGLAVPRGWLCLNGAALGGSCSAAEAARRQIAVDRDPEFLDGLRWALQGARDVEVVRCGVEIEDGRVVRLAGEAVARDSSLFGELQFPSMKAQAVWREALRVDKGCWRGAGGGGKDDFYSILDGLADGGEWDSALVETLSSTPLGDLGCYSRRREIWDRVGDPSRGRLLAATARGWLDEVDRRGVPYPAECELQGAIMQELRRRGTLARLMRDRVGTAVQVATVLREFGESEFVVLLRDRLADATALDGAEAEAIGGLVRSRGWKATAGEIVDRYRRGRPDLRPSLRVCYDLLGWWERFELGLMPVSDGEKWERFQEVAVELYPSGPDEQGLWERAGGQDGDLVGREEGRTRWRKAIQGMRRGRGPTMAAVLNIIGEDFPNNERVARLGAEDGVARNVDEGEGRWNGLD